MQGAGNLGYERLLEIDNLALAKLIMASPNLGAVARVDEINSDFQDAVETPYRSSQDGSNAEFLPESKGRSGARLQSSYGTPGHHVQICKKSEPSYESFGYSIDKILELRISRNVVERENRQRTNPTRGPHETIPSTGNRFDESGGCGTFSKGTANLPDAEIEAMFEVNERVRTPKLIPEFLSRYQFAGPLDQMDEQSERLWAKPDAVIELPQLHCMNVESKRTKP
jgi:hypothetical protein